MEYGKQIGVLVMVAVALIVGMILLQTSAQQIGDVSNTETLANVSLNSIAVSNTAQYWTGYRSLSSVVIFNATNATGNVTTAPQIGSGNYTITNNAIDPTTGGLSVNITPGTITTGYNSIWLVSGTAQRADYIDDSGARAIAGVIIIMFAIALAVIALYPTMKEWGWGK